MKNPKTNTNNTFAPSSSFSQKNEMKYINERDDKLTANTLKEKYIPAPLT